MKAQSNKPLHCSGRVADIGCRTSNSAGIWSIAACIVAMRGSVSNVSRSGGGDGAVISQLRGRAETVDAHEQRVQVRRIQNGVGRR